MSSKRPAKEVRRRSPPLITKTTSSMIADGLMRVIWIPIRTNWSPTESTVESLGGIKAGLFTVAGEEDDTNVNDEFYEEVVKTEDDTVKKEQDKSAETYKLAGEVYTEEEVDRMLGD
jgi:hypothetical protein